MELFNMVAKLTLNSSGFMSDLDKAERRAKNFRGSDDFVLGLDTSEFEDALHQAQEASAGFKGPTDPKLNLDTSEFDESLTGAETDSENFDGPEDQDVDLDTSAFDENLSDAETDAENFEGPEDQDVDLDTSGFTGAMEGAEERSSDFETNIGGIMQNVAGAIAAAGIGAAITKAFSKLSDIINLASTTADEVDKGSRRLNLSTKAYQEWTHALGQSGATISDFQRGILTVNNLLAGDQISEDATAAFAALGVSMHDANGKLKTTEEFLNDTVIALSKLPAGAKRSNLVTAIFGRGGDSLNALLDSGEEGIQELIKEAHELALGIAEFDTLSYAGQGLLGVVDELGGLAHGGHIEFGRRHIGTNEADVLGLELHHLGLGVLGEVEHHRTWTAAAGDIEGTGDGPGDILGMTDLIAPLGDGLCHTHEIDLLEGVGTQGTDGHLSGDDDDRRGVEHGIGQSRQRVRGTRTTSDQRHAYLATDAGITLGGMGSGLFVTDEDMVESLLVASCVVVKGIIDGHDGTAGVAEDGCHTLCLQGLHQCL